LSNSAQWASSLWESSAWFKKAIARDGFQLDGQMLEDLIFIHPQREFLCCGFFHSFLSSDVPTMV